MPSITFLHTAEVHVDTFDRLMDEFVPDYSCRHIVHEEWLAEAREQGMSSQLEARVTDTLLKAGEDADAVLCTCSTLGPIADRASAEQANIVRIDRPVMEKAVALDGAVVVAFCLESTRAPTLELIHSAAADRNRPCKTAEIVCCDAWTFFERGDKPGFGQAISKSIRPALAAIENPSCLVLAQASMTAAEPYLEDLDIPVLSSPRPAMEAVLHLTAR